MAQYINKDALVAEIEKLIENGKLKCQQSKENNDYESHVAWSEHIATCAKILFIIDTLEVKEVDLEKEYKEFVEKDPVYNMLVNGIVGRAIAKHFFELGLKTQHSSISIPNIDDLLEEDGINPYSKDAKLFKECYYTALERYKEKKGIV